MTVHTLHSLISSVLDRDISLTFARIAWYILNIFGKARNSQAQERFSGASDSIIVDFFSWYLSSGVFTTVIYLGIL